MDTSARELLDLLGGFVVQVSGPDLRGGSGFFAGRGLVVTCAHVVALPARGGSRATAARARVTWLGGHAEGSVVAVPPAHRGKGLWRPPDLAVITLDEPVSDHPWIRMAEGPPRLGQHLHAVGYSAVYEQTSRLGVTAVSYEGPQFHGADQTVLQLKDGELAPGKSGGPLLDLERGEVCGIVTTSRRENLDMGGLALAMSAVRHTFPELWEANKAPSSLDPELWRLRAALQPEHQPGTVLSLREEKTLLHAAQRSGLAPAALYWRSVHRDYGESPGRLDSMADALREVADAPAMLNGPHPLLLFIRQVTDAACPQDADPLTGLLDLVARRLGVPAPPPTAVLSAAGTNRVAAISVHLDTQTPDGDHYFLRVWKYPDVMKGEPPYPVLCDDQPLTLDEAQEQFRAVVPSAIRDLAEISSDLLIEFALPTAKLSAVDVDTWYLSQAWAPVSWQYPVVLRALDRKPETYPSWITRWQRLSHGPHVDTAMDWVDCRRDLRPKEFFAWLQQQPDLSVLALPFSPDATARQHVLETALYAGIPVAVWTRAGCSVRCRLRQAPGQGRALTAVSDAPSEACAGSAFRDEFAAELARSSFSDLPKLIRKLRVDAATAPGHCGEKVVLLWDDAKRKLPIDGPALRIPDDKSQGRHAN
ncbi:VMAP-related conflict system protein [Streptomyces sp. NPDC005799]|uniref:VMAP-related conflict system protein n=1 Tax=Streptomyces sp. NPDC005799 TaxID=3154678 RepID=UPI0033C0AA40